METNLQSKPPLVMAIALMTLVNGVFNILWGIGIILSTIGLSLLCFPVPLFPIVLGGFEISYAIKLLANPPQPVQPSQGIAIGEIAAIVVGNVFSLIVGILALVFYNDVTVRDYFARLNGTAVPAPAAIPTPSLPVDPAPVAPPSAESTPEVPAPAEPEIPEPPKRRPRKVAGR